MCGRVSLPDPCAGEAAGSCYSSARQTADHFGFQHSCEENRSLISFLIHNKFLSDTVTLLKLHNCILTFYEQNKPLISIGLWTLILDSV